MGFLFALREFQGEEALSSEARLLYIVSSIILVLMAGLMSGLTIGLMAMDEMEMEVLMRSGTNQEKKYAAAIAPLLENHHYLLCTLVLWNAVAMEALPLFLDKLADPITAVLLSVTVVLIFGEIVPQGVCTRYGLAVGYYASWLVRALMIIAFPVAYPLGKVLDAVLGHSPTALPRGQLQQFVTLHGEDEGYARFGEALTRNETHVINSALELTEKTAKAAMTPLEKVFMVSSNAVWNSELCEQLIKTGHSRVPVHAPGDRSSILGQILVKEQLLVKKGTPVSSLKIRPLPALSASMPMWDLLHLFKIGRTHMAVLCEASDDQRRSAAKSLEMIGFSEEMYVGASSFNLGGPSATTSAIIRKHEAKHKSEGDDSELPVSNMATEPLQDMFINATIGTPVGVITMEDVVEELLGDEIIDETDLYIDNNKSRRINTDELNRSLPRNLRALLNMGVFASAGARSSVRQRTLDDSVSVPLLEDEPAPLRRNAAISVPSMGMYSQAQAVRPSQSVPSVPNVDSGAGEAPSAEQVGAAIDKLQQHLDHPEIASALGTLQEAMAPPPGLSDAHAAVWAARTGVASSGGASPRMRASSAIQSTKRSASMHLRDKFLAPHAQGDTRAPSNPS